MRQGVTVVARSRTRLIALVLAAGLGLVGCTGSGEPKSAVAVEVGDRTLTVEELQGVVETLRKTDPNSNLARNEASGVQQQLISQIVTVELKDELLSREGIALDESGMDTMKRQLEKENQTLPEWMIDDAVRGQQMDMTKVFQALLGDNYKQQTQQMSEDKVLKLYEREMRALAGDLGLEINPRYGEFDPVKELQQQPAINAQGGQLVELTEPETPESPMVGQ